MQDQTKFENLVATHHRSVTTFARSLARDHWQAEEATHLTFIKAWQYLDSFRGEGSFEGWLLTICRRVVIDQASGNQIEIPMEAVPECQTYDQDPVEIESILADLPLAQREVITLCGLLGYDYESASKVLGIPVGTVRSRLHRARAALRLADGLGGVA